MKTIKKTIVVTLVLSVITICATVSKKSVNNINASLHDSTHQGYRTMVADYIF